MARRKTTTMQWMIYCLWLVIWPQPPPPLPLPLLSSLAASAASSSFSAAPSYFMLPIHQSDFVDMLVGRSHCDVVAGHVATKPVTGRRIYIASDGVKVRGYSTHEDSSNHCENAFHRAKAVASDAAGVVTALGLASFGQSQRVARRANTFFGANVSATQLRRATDAAKSAESLLGIAKFDDKATSGSTASVGSKTRRLQLMAKYAPVPGALSARFSNEL